MAKTPMAIGPYTSASDQNSWRLLMRAGGVPAAERRGGPDGRLRPRVRYPVIPSVNADGGGRSPLERKAAVQAATARPVTGPASSSGMASDGVAAGEGAWRTHTTPPVTPSRKSSTSDPSRSTAWARTPASARMGPAGRGIARKRGRLGRGDAVGGGG